MKPFSRSWVKVNQKTWRHKEEDFTICNESYNSISGLRVKLYCIYGPQGKNKDGKLLASKDSFFKARWLANTCIDEWRKGLLYE